MTKLREIAHSRTGDKGNISNISVIAMTRSISVAACAGHQRAGKSAFRRCCRSEVVALLAVPIQHCRRDFVMAGALGAGDTVACARLAHGKS